MFDQLFPDARALARQRDGPLADERRRYLVYCAEQHMAHKTMLEIARGTLLVAKILRLAERPGELITREEVQNTPQRKGQSEPSLDSTLVTGLEFSIAPICPLRNTMACLPRSASTKDRSSSAIRRASQQIRRLHA